MKSKSTIDPAEIDKFSKIAKEWWKPDGELRTLHQINPVRLKYIKTTIESHFGSFPTGLKVLDIGCGGGLASVPLSRIGAAVTGLDASEENIQAAKVYAAEQGLNINYICGTAEEHQGLYDVVLALEIIEHTANPELFVQAASKLIKPSGMIILSTINRTKKAYLMAIAGAEYLLKWVPVGTHEFAKFVTPAEMAGFLRSNNMLLRELKGLSYNVLTQSWSLSNDIEVNYFAYATR